MLIYNHGNLSVLFLEYLQKLCKRNTFRHRLNGANFKIGHGGVVREKIGILNMNEPNDVVFIFFEHWVARKFILAHEIKICFQIIIHINTQNLCARRHNGFRIFVIKIENIIEILVLIFINRTTIH